jgi:Tol biopolymer transport system component
LSGKIAFPAYDPDRQAYDLYVASPDGSGMERVLDEASQPALSPDGQLVALRRWWGGGRGIVLMSTLGGGERRLSEFFEDGLPSWSPDGQSLLFFSRRESDRQPRLYRVILSDGSELGITRDGGAVIGEYPSWMADGSIVYRTLWPDRGLAVMNAAGSGQRTVLLDDSATAPAGSPDGAYIAFMSTRDGNWEIYRSNVDGSDLVRLTDDGANDGLPTWSPDGQTIAFVSDRAGGWGMWAMTAAGQAQTQLFALPGPAHGLVEGEPDFSAQGWLEERISWRP